MLICILGDEVGWVQCDPCSNWYHVICIGITAEDADAMDTYVCSACQNKNATTTTADKWTLFV